MNNKPDNYLDEKPEDVSIPKDKSWDELTYNQQYYLVNKENNYTDKKPEGVSNPHDEEWEDLSYRQQYFLVNRENNYRKREERRDRIRNWLRDKKEELGCSRCSENHPDCIDFHHEDENNKTAEISELVSDGYGKETIKDEIEKCTALCANCHRKLHSDYEQ